ncbi:3-deoxy-D-manno-octulosonic acid kinase [Luteimonas kalidii]|uniref:3-deoxy-D-manno-octulosonic acid kinase n=1 Tax=Luteimonas kalidii TaxID=3042025 RepID=A0ABT6JVL7_9GAMM|nr:3-deoxy-D-manno-octulosonic acid kinase [Luteimonas kalidii]MDH5834725.1 3-deoxy-D-manno-octulosonic acid kinase [Luteimonas kalidii]
MAAFDATESLTPFHDDRGSGEYGAILFDMTQLRQVDPRWFDPHGWGSRAQQVGGSGRGGAWFIDASHGALVLRQYLRGGLAAKFSRERYLWRGANHTRSFAEFRLLRELLRRKCPVPQPVAACYLRGRVSYRAWIIVERLEGVRSLASLVEAEPEEAPWEASGRLVARFHREGLDHADLNAHNVLFDPAGKGWMIDFDRSRLHIPATAWRERNLQRLLRSLHKVAGDARREAVEAGFGRLRAAYDARWAKGN